MTRQRYVDYEAWADYYRPRPLEFIQRYYIESETLKPIKLFPWQIEKILNPLYSRVDNRLRYQIVVLGLPKGNGKTRIGAAIALHKLLTAPRNAELFASANSKDQATRAWRDVAAPLQRNPELMKFVKISRKGDDIRVLPTEATYCCISAEDITAHGMRPFFVHFDEMHGQRERELYVAIQTSMGKIPDAQLMITSTAGVLNSILREIYQKAVQEQYGTDFDDSVVDEIIIKGLKSDPRFYMWWSFENLLPSAKDPVYLERERQVMTPMEFARWHLNRWVSDATSLIGPEDIARCQDKDLQLRTTALPGVQHVWCCDVGLKNDNTCIVIGHRDPETSLIYLDYIKTLIPQPKKPIQMSDIEREVLFAHNVFHPVQYVVDQHQTASLMERASRSGIHIEELHITQAINTELATNLYQTIHNGQIKWPLNDPECKAMETELMTLITKETMSGIRFDHPKHGKSDRATALAMLITMIRRKPNHEPRLWVI